MNKNNQCMALYISVGVLLAGLYEMTLQGGIGTTILFLVFILVPVFVIGVCMYISYHMIGR